MIKPARGIILVEPIKDTEKTPVGVYLPESSKDKPMKGKVIGAGAIPFDSLNIMLKLDGKVGGLDLVSLSDSLQEGDIVYYKRWGNEEVKENGKEYVFLRFEDILGVQDATK